MVTITINGSTDDEPVISVVTNIPGDLYPDSAAETLAETNSGLTTSGTLTVNDVDLNDTVEVAVLSVAVQDQTSTTTGLGSNAQEVQDALDSLLAGSLTLTTGQIAADTGDVHNIAWTFDSGAVTFDYLAVGEHLTLTYTI